MKKGMKKRKEYSEKKSRLKFQLKKNWVGGGEESSKKLNEKRKNNL